MKATGIFLILHLFVSYGYGQNSILFTIGENQVMVDEFAYTFAKNNNGDATKDEIDEYLTLYINFKLKVIEARANGLDTLESYLTELNTYIIQLTEPYLTEKGVTEGLIREGYERLKEEVHVSHILLTLPENYTSEDTIEVFSRAEEIYKLTTNSDFEELVLKYSEEPAVIQTKGDLGYFTAFQMVYPFETAAYNTAIGEISSPIRSRFGYHLIKVHDKRVSNGKVQVSHIMLRFQKNMTKEDSLVLEDQIIGIQNLVLDNYNWEELVKNYSQDVNSKEKDGVLNPFGVGEMIPEIAEVAFSLDTIGQISDPVKSIYGWHILRMENREEIGSFESMQTDLERKVSRDSRSNKSQEALIIRLKSENQFYEDSLGNLFRNQTQLLSGKYTDSLKNISSILFHLNDSAYLVDDFYRYILNKKIPKKAVNILYEDFVTTSIINNERTLLPDKYPDFRHLMREYHEGILLFDIMNEQIWGPSSTDSVQLKSYFENNFMNYTTEERVSISIFESSLEFDTVQSFIEKIFLDSTSLRKDKEQVILEQYPDLSILQSGSFKKGETEEANFKTQGIYPFNGSILVVWEHHEERSLSFEETRGRVIADYQIYLETVWVDELRSRYPVEVNKKVLKKVYREFED